MVWRFPEDVPDWLSTENGRAFAYLAPQITKWGVMALCMPSCRDPKAGAMDGFHQATKRNLAIMPVRESTSALPFCFNRNWVNALNGRRQYPIGHFAMIHDDVCPEGPWLDVLLDELYRTGADVMSAVVPIKNALGLTSTAVETSQGRWRPRKLTMHEVFELPETFGAEDVPWREPGMPLLVNTGLWVCKFDAWVEKVAFHFYDRIVNVRRPDGTMEFEAHFQPEDWDFSRQCHDLGLKVMATRKVKLHHARQEFMNSEPWGEWDKDEGFLNYRGDLELNLVA